MLLCLRMHWRRLLWGTWLCALSLGCGGSAGDQAGPSLPRPKAAAAREQSPPQQLAATDTGRGRAAGADQPAAAPEKPKHANRLASQTSPYLLLHAHNPVDWYPWGPEALEKAKKENKLIFLSVGYSSCYWCHVMERESFMDEEIAAFLNEHFVSIKIDREERPDIDQIYMAAVQQLGRSGGWPLSMFLTPEGKPFFGGTYFPARDGDRENATGFLTIVQKMQEIWRDDPQRVREVGDAVADAVRQQLRTRRPLEPIELDASMIAGVMEYLQEDFDERYGGFGYDVANPQRPKFPEPSNLLFLIERVRSKDVENWEDARRMLTHTLDKMAQGGIYDQIGGGFHRYSTDRYWAIPHFEKMLYDNGQLASVYAEAFSLTGNVEYRRIATGILDFVQREMTDDSGGFYAALDAETEAEEGKFYRWERGELEKIIGPERIKLFGEIYHLDGEPNFEEKYYVPLLSQSLTDSATQHGMTIGELQARLAPLRQRLLAVRNARPRPLTDTKVLTAWNGLMIRGFADAGRILKDERYVDVAEKAAGFILNANQKDGRLLRTSTAGESKLNAYLDDYAFLIDGLVALHRAGRPDAKSLEPANRLIQKQIDLFWDERDGGFYYTSKDHEELFARAKNPIDAEIPSGNSVSAGNLLYLAEHLKKPEYREMALRTMQSTALYLKSSPGALPRMALHVGEFLGGQERGAPDAGQH